MRCLDGIPTPFIGRSPRSVLQINIYKALLFPKRASERLPLVEIYILTFPNTNFNLFGQNFAHFILVTFDEAE